MSKFKVFYNNLDFLNMILFWGVLIVIILIIIFMILYFSRKKHRFMEEDTQYDELDDIDIIKKDEFVADNNVITKNQLFSELDDGDSSRKDEFIVKDRTNNDVFVNKDDFILNKDNNETEGLKENVQLELKTDFDDNKDKKIKEEKNMSLFEDFIPLKEDKNKAYQKNVFREMNARNQTSPIGIIYEKKEKPVEEYTKEPNDKYINDVYSSLEKAKVPDKIELTDYEKRQEEDAVISYSELLKKKDTINYDPEEDAVISYSELLDRKNRLYNIREEEEDKEFLSELKKFRRDL